MESEYYCYQADLFDQKDGEALIEMLDAYAQDPMGGGEALSEYSRTHLLQELQSRASSTHVFLVRKRADGSKLQRKQTDEVCGIAVCFDGFSTFYCQKLLNIHDFATKFEHRRKGLGAMLLMEIDQYCRHNSYCKITLEVLEGNHAARKLYSEMGFAAYELDPVMGRAMFWQKLISEDK